MIGVMSKKKASDEGPRKGRPPGPETEPLSMRLPVRLKRLLEELTARTRGRTVTIEVIIALENHLRANGLLGEDEVV